MAGIDATLVKMLRDMTGAGVIACRNALVETHGDVDAAVDRLRAEEASKAAKKSDRVAAEGLVALTVDGTRAAIVELNTETDFVARTEAFQQAAASLARSAFEAAGDRDALLDAPSPDGNGRVSDLVVRLAARTGEHVNLRRAAFVSIDAGVVASYTHSAVAPSLGRIGVLVALEGHGPADVLLGLGRAIAMHIAASSPLWISRADIPAEVVVEKRRTLIEQAQSSGKSPAIVEKMVEGRLRRFCEETVLGLQPFALNPGQRVWQVIEEAAMPIAIKSFVRFRVGEGLQSDSRQSVRSWQNDVRRR
jgi:elongation factor Ts